MIKIVKSGKKEFYCICDNCGCEFTCELEDLKFEPGLTNSRIRVAICPECGNTCYINTPKNTPPTPLPIGWPTPGEPIPCSPAETNKIDPCKDCDWLKKLASGITYVGDVPCTWCAKGPYRVTCGTLHGNGTTDILSGVTCTYTGKIGSYTVDPVMNEYMSSLATGTNETNKADLSCTCNNINSCLKRTEVFSNNNCCCKD
jgi:hypothetical protein